MATSIYHIRYWPTWLGIAALRLFALLPLTCKYRIAKAIGLLVYRLHARRRSIVETNIALCFPELDAQQQKHLVRKNFIATAYGIVEITLGFWASKAFFLKHSEMRGLELLEQAKTRGQGVLLLGLHATSLEISGCTLTHRFTPVGTTYKQPDNLAFDAYLLKMRQKALSPVLEKQQMRSMIKALKDGQVIWFAPDQDFGREGSVFAPFFNVPTATSDNLGKILKLTKAKALFYNHYRITKDGKPYFIGEILDPFQNQLADDPVLNATLFNQAIETAVRLHPEQYLWSQKRFRTRPNPADEKLYRSAKRKKRK